MWHHGAADEERTFTISYRVDRGRGRLRRRDRRRLGRVGRPMGLRPRRAAGHVHGPAPGPRRPALPRLGSCFNEAPTPTPSASTERPSGARASRRSRPPTSPTTRRSRCGSRFRARRGRTSAAPASTTARACRRSSPRRSSSTRTSVRPGLASSAGSRTTRCCCRSRSRRSSSALLALLSWLAREHPTDAPQYIPEPPDDADPALAYGLAHEGGDSTDTVLATLLDLVDRGYYKASSASTGRREARPRARGQRRATSHRRPGGPREAGPDVLRRAARRRDRPDQRDARQDPAALGDLARALGEHDRGPRRGRGGAT